MAPHLNLNIENMFSKSSALFLVLSLFGCGGEKEQRQESVRQTEVMVTLVFPEHLAEEQKNNFKEKISIYCFQFYGNFPERGHQPRRDDVDAKKFNQHVFSDLPYDEHLKIIVYAFDATHTVQFCLGEAEISYFEGKKDRVEIPLNCS